MQEETEQYPNLIPPAPNPYRPWVAQAFYASWVTWYTKFVIIHGGVGRGPFFHIFFEVFTKVWRNFEKFHWNFIE